MRHRVIRIVRIVWAGGVDIRRWRRTMRRPRHVDDMHAALVGPVIVPRHVRRNIEGVGGLRLWRVLGG